MIFKTYKLTTLNYFLLWAIILVLFIKEQLLYVQQFSLYKNGHDFRDRQILHSIFLNVLIVLSK